jgi:Cu+-exporting ATPase
MYLVLILTSIARSCVHTIEETLFFLSPPPSTINVSVASRWVKVYHPEDLSSTAIESTLIDAGFDVLQAPLTLPVIRSQSPLFGERTKRQRHMEQCSACKTENGDDTICLQDKEPEKKDLDSFAQVDLRFDEAFKFKLEKSSDNHTTLQAIDDDVTNNGPWRVTLSIGGMTCSACSTTVINVMTELSGVSDVSVSLLEGSATAVIDDKTLVDVIAEAVEDCGFEAQVVKVESLLAKSGDEVDNKTRIISLRVGGLFSRYVCICQRSTDVLTYP